MPDYQKGKIYKLWSPSQNLVYYGSTIQPLSQRISGHLKQFIRYNKGTSNYVSSYLILECEDYKIELVENYPCNNKQQLEKKEGEYIKNNECVNIYIPCRTTQEYREDNKEEISNKKKKKYEENKEEVLEKNRKNYENSKEKILEKKKEYYEANKEKIKERREAYYEANKK